jgi:NADP-dependent 3-hydroxy acid dehydrogenase YdfG
MEQLAGQVAVVTGAGSGIGRGIAAALASKAWAHFGHVDIAVNNAGVFPPSTCRRYQGDEAIDTRAVMARPRISAEGRP